MESRQEILEAVSSNALFLSVDPDAFNLRIDDRRVYEYAEGEFVYRKDDRTLGVYLILRGSVKLKKELSEEATVRETKWHGDYFGEEEYLEGVNRRGAATADEDATLYLVDKRELNEMTERDPAILRNLKRFAVAAEASPADYPEVPVNQEDDDPFADMPAYEAGESSSEEDDPLADVEAFTAEESAEEAGAPSPPSAEEAEGALDEALAEEESEEEEEMVAHAAERALLRRVRWEPSYEAPHPRTAPALTKVDVNRVLNASRAVYAADDFATLQRVAVEVSAQLTGADKGVVYVFDDERELLWTELPRGGRIEKRRLRVGEGIVGKAISENVALNASKETVGKFLDEKRDSIAGYRILSTLAYPLRDDDGAPVGVLQLFNHPEGEFKERALQIVKRLSPYVADALRRLKPPYPEDDKPTGLRGEARAGEEDDEAKGGLDDVLGFLSDNYLYHVNAAADVLDRLKRNRVLPDNAIELGVFLAAIRGESNAFERTIEDARNRVENPELVSGLSVKDRYALYGDMTEYVLARMKTAFEKGRGAAKGMAPIDEAGKACRRAVDLAESARVFVEVARDLFIGKPNVEREIRPLGGVVEGYLAQVADYASASGLSLRKKIATDAKVDIDDSRLYQAFWQIVRNAAQATPGGGALYVAAKTSDDRAVVSFKDDGFGMTEETRARLFEPFFSYGGGAAGLGVPLARFLVKEAGGEIAVSGAPSEGTLVEFSLPLATDGE